ncbi:MAG: hypothetical protein Q9195_005633 [Heterodermia aff. obscurata]
MSTAPTLPHVAESQVSDMTPKALTQDNSLSDPPLAMLFEQFPIMGHGYQFRTPTREASAAEVLQFLEDIKSPVTLDIGEILQQMLHDINQAIIAVPKNETGTLEALEQSLWTHLLQLRELVQTIRTAYRNTEEHAGPSPGSVVLCLDGGGIKSYSTLLIIQELMKKVRKHQKLKVHIPRDYFDYIFGSSSGGLIAIMLGRLKMDIDECLINFETYADEIFGHPRMFNILTLRITNRTKYGRRILERASRRVVKDFGKSPDGRVWKINTFAAPQDQCRTGVIASCVNTSLDDAFPYMFRSYDSLPSIDSSDREQSKFDKSDPKGAIFPRNMTSASVASNDSRASARSEQRNGGPAVSLPIWAVAKATSAAPFYFDPVHIDNKRFVDGGLGCNNPSLEACNEVSTMHHQHSDSKDTSSASPVSLFLSIGSGLKTSQKQPTGFLKEYRSMIYLLRSIATDTEDRESLVRSLSVNHHFPYFRFNVDKGVGELKIDEWKRPKKGRESETLTLIRAATREYLDREDTQHDLEDCAQLLIKLRRLRL